MYWLFFFVLLPYSSLTAGYSDIRIPSSRKGGVQSKNQYCVRLRKQLDTLQAHPSSNPAHQQRKQELQDTYNIYCKVKL